MASIVAIITGPEIAGWPEGG